MLDEDLKEFEILFYFEGKRKLNPKDVLKFSVIIEPFDNESKILQIEKEEIAALSTKDGKLSATVGMGGELKEVRIGGNLCLQHFGLLASASGWELFGNQRTAEEVSFRKGEEGESVEIKGTIFNKYKSFGFKEKIEIIDDRIILNYALRPNTDIKLDAITIQGFLPASQTQGANWYIFNQDGLKEGEFYPWRPKDPFLFKETKYAWSGWILKGGEGIKFLTPDWPSKIYQVQLQDNRIWGKQDFDLAFFVNCGKLWKTEDFIRFSVAIEPFRITPQFLKKREELKEITVQTELEKGVLIDTVVGAGGQLETIKINGKTCLKDFGVVIKNPDWTAFGSQSDCIKTQATKVKKDNIIEIEGQITNEGKSIGFEETIEILPDKIKLDYTLKPKTDIAIQAINLSGYLPVGDAHGASWHLTSISGLQEGEFPVNYNKEENKPLLALDYEFDEAGWILKSGYGIKFLIPNWKETMTQVQLQDDREWAREEFELVFFNKTKGFLTPQDVIQFQAVIEPVAK